MSFIDGVLTWLVSGRLWVCDMSLDMLNIGRNWND